MKAIARTVLIFHGFSELFALSSYVSISFFLEIIYLFLVVIFSGRIFNSKFQKQFSFFFLILFIVTYCFNIVHGIIDEQSLINLLQYAIILFHIYVLTDIFLRFGAKFFFNNFLIGFLIVIGYGYLDFFLSNFLSISLDNVIPRSAVQYNTGSQLGMMRMRSVFREAGYYANYLNVCGLILLGYFGDKKTFSVILIAYISSLLLTFSGAGIVCAFILLAVKFILFSNKNIIKNIGLFLIVMSLALGSVSFLSDNIYALKLVDKIMLDDSSTSVSDRANRYSYLSNDLEVLTENPTNLFLGLGNGYLVNEKRSYLNVYLNFLVSNGLIVFCIYLIILGSCIFYSLRLARKEHFYEYAFLSILAFSFHFLFTQGVFILVLWLPLICVGLVEQNNKLAGNNSR